MANSLENCSCYDFFFRFLENFKRATQHGLHMVWEFSRSRLKRSSENDSSVDRKRGERKGATSKNVTKVSNFFSTFSRRAKKRQKSSKSVKKYFRHFSTIFARHQFSGPFWGALNEEFSSENEIFKRKVCKFGAFNRACFFVSRSGPLGKAWETAKPRFWKFWFSSSALP